MVLLEVLYTRWRSLWRNCKTNHQSRQCNWVINKASKQIIKRGNNSCYKKHKGKQLLLQNVQSKVSYSY